MHSPKLARAILPALFGALGLLVIVGLPSIAANDNSQNEQCVNCHAEMVLRESTKTNVHLPFFEHQCTACHVGKNLQVSNPFANEPSSFASGTLASSGFKWSNRRVFKSASAKTKDHLLALSGLELNQHYRFRIHLAEPQTAGLESSTTSVWFNLSPADLPDLATGTDLSPLRIEDFPAQFNQMVLALTLNRSAKAVYLAWTNMELPTYGWVELEEFNAKRVSGNNLADNFPDSSFPNNNFPKNNFPNDDASNISAFNNGDLNSDLLRNDASQRFIGEDENEAAEDSRALAQEQEHPAMITAAELAIDVCNTCHSDDLGTSHPVRIYSNGKSTQIPDDLPTVEDGMITCVTCHDPHAGMGKQLVREKIATKLCVACHYQFLNKSRSTTF